ncbi:MAG: AraC family transcriptional regulator [Bacteroidales bacterium]
METHSHQKQLLRQEYIARINRVMDFVERNLSADLNLETLAGVANFSPFHFHRLFSAMTGETLNHFIRRARLERAEHPQKKHIVRICIPVKPA